MRSKLKLTALAFFCLGFFSCAGIPNGNTHRAPANSGLGFFSLPSDQGVTALLDAIGNAETSIQMTMFHLTIPEVIAAFKKVDTSKVRVTLLLDQENLAKGSGPKMAADLRSHGIN